MGTAADTSLIGTEESVCAAARDNQLLGCLAADDLARIVATAELTSFDANVHIAMSGDMLERVYFPVGGYASLIVSDTMDARMQIALVGLEGILGWEALLGLDRFLFDVYVPETLRTLSLDVGDFRILAAGDERWLTIHLKCLARLVDAVAQGVVCTRFHVLEARLARFLLEVYDRHPRMPIRLTQSTLANLLGVRRVSVTNAATHLQLLGLINYSRGEIRLLDRNGLEAAACDCYRYRYQVHER